MYNIITLMDNLISTDTFLFKFNVYVYVATFNHTQLLTGRKNIFVSTCFILLIDHFKKLTERINLAICR